MAARSKPRRFIPIPILGLNTAGPAQFLDDRETPDCQNVRVSRSEIIQTPGYGTMGASFSAPMMLFAEFTREGVKYFLGLSTGAVKEWINSSATWSDVTGGTLNGLATQPLDYAVAKISGKNVFVFTNYIDNIKKWTGSGNIADLGGSPPKCKYLLNYEGYLLAAYIKDGTDVYEQKVQWPDTDDPETWTQSSITNAGEQMLDDGHEITGLIRLSNLAVVAKEGSIWNGYLTGDNRVFQFETKETRMGFLVGNTIRNIPGNNVMGLSKYGIITYNGIQAQLVAPKIADDLRWNTNPQHIGKAFGMVVSELDEYWLFVPSLNSSYLDLVYRYNYFTGQVFKDTCPDLTAAGMRSQLEGTVWDDVTDTWDTATGRWDDVIVNSIFQRLIVGDNDGQCYRLSYDLKNYGSTAIDAYWTSKDVYKEGHYSHWVEIDAELAGDAVDVYYSVDEGATFTLLRSITGLTDEVLNYKIMLSVVSHKVRVRFRNATADSSFKLRNLTIYYREREQV